MPWLVFLLSLALLPRLPQRRVLAALASVGAAVPLAFTAIVEGPPISSFSGADTVGTWVCLSILVAVATVLAVADVASATAQMLA